MSTRRGFLGVTAAMVAAAAVDPERLLWVPGKKLISIPAPTPAFSEEEWQQAFAFYRGDQWPAEVRRARQLAGRPVVTINRLFGIVQAQASERRVNYEGWRALIVETYRKFGDQQRLYNFLASNHIERAWLRLDSPEPRLVPSLDHEQFA